MSWLFPTEKERAAKALERRGICAKHCLRKSESRTSAGDPPGWFYLLCPTCATEFDEREKQEEERLKRLVCA